MMQHEPIDAVITWVDGNEPVFAQKLTHYLLTQGLERKEGAAPTRFHSCGELDYCLRSILHFIPWIRTIHVVTDAQTPQCLASLQGSVYEQRVKLVDHRDIFRDFEQYLPTFNSLSIESMLWRIPNLAEQFIYFNDDAAIIRPLEPHDFFRQGLPVLRGQWKTLTEKKWGGKWRRLYAAMRGTPYLPKSLALHRRLEETSAQLLGFNARFFHLPHLPFPLRKQTFVDFFEMHPGMLEHNIRHPLRDITQFMPVSVAYHLDIKRHQVVFDNQYKGITCHATHHSTHGISKRLNRAEKDKCVAFVCMQSLDEGTPAVQQRLFDWLQQRIPNIPSPR